MWTEIPHQTRKQGNGPFRAGVSAGEAGDFASPRGAGRGVVPVVTVPIVLEGPPIILDGEDFQYQYRCGHCGHECQKNVSKKIKKVDPNAYLKLILGSMTIARADTRYLLRT